MKSAWIYFLLTLVMIPSTILSWITLTSPSPSGNLSRYSFIVITPKEAQANTPTVWLGLFGSCARGNDSLPVICANSVLESRFSLRRNYDLSVLPSDAALFVLEPPPAILRALALTTTSLSCVLLGLLVLMTWILSLIRRANERLQSFLCQIKTWLAMIAFLILSISVVNISVIEVYFDTACQHFNVYSSIQGSPKPEFVASIQGHFFDLAYLGCWMVAIPLTVILVDVFFTSGTPLAGRIRAEGANTKDHIISQARNAEDLVKLIRPVVISAIKTDSSSGGTPIAIQIDIERYEHEDQGSIHGHITVDPQDVIAGFPNTN